MAPPKPKRVDAKKRPIFDEWECPDCTAHNPNDNGFTFGDELFCNWCGQVFVVRKVNEEEFKLVVQ